MAGSTVNTMGLDQYPLKIAFVVIPNDVTRRQYIRNCKQNNTVSCITESGAYYNDVRVNKSDLDLGTIIFPQEKGQRGSALALMFPNKHSIPLCISVFNLDNELSNNPNENSFSISKTYNGQSVNISGDAITGTMNISVNSGENPANLNVSIQSKNNDAKADVSVAGQVNVFASKNINAQSETLIKSKVKNDNGESFSEITESEIKNVSPSIINASNPDEIEKMLLGETTLQFLKDLFTILKTQTFTNAAGTTAVTNNVADFEKLEATINDILSKTNKLD